MRRCMQRFYSSGLQTLNISHLTFTIYGQCGITQYLLLAEYQKKNRTINKCDFLILNRELVIL
jgi:hypothetical protein